MKTKIICVANHKGGCGKSSTAINLAYGLANKGLKTLVIDHDPQRNTTVAFGKRVIERTLYDSLYFHSRLLCHKITDKIWLVPSDVRLFNIDRETANWGGRNKLLTEAINDIKNGFDIIIIDCPPNNGLATNGSLLAANYLLIPAEAALFSLQGIQAMVKESEAASALNPNLEFLGVLISRYRKTKDHEFALAEVREMYKDKVFDTIIRESSAISAAQLARKSIFEYSPKSNGASDYANLTDEICKRLKIR